MAAANGWRGYSSLFIKCRTTDILLSKNLKNMQIPKICDHYINLLSKFYIILCFWLGPPADCKHLISICLVRDHVLSKKKFQPVCLLVLWSMHVTTLTANDP